ncbi:MAG: hypothetical protein RLZZ158_140 [Cyanobacteriota bacterium]
MARSDSREPPSLLPVAYRSPWEQLRSDLGRDLPAVGASVALRLRELWRRNREGDLSVPGFWPLAWTPLFWPVLALLVLLSLGVLLRLPLQSHGPGASPSAAEIPGLPLPTPLAAERTPFGSGASALEINESGPSETVANPAGANQLAESLAGGAAPGFSKPIPLGPADPPENASVAGPQLVPLLALLEAKEGAAMVGSIHPVASQGLLQLIPSAAFFELPSGQQQGQANGWQQQSRNLGYDRLELRSVGGQLLGRSALVGEGMILWSTPQP